jgi:hypothetical protein
MPLNIRPKHGGNGDKFGRGMPWVICDLAPVGKRLVRGSAEAKNFWTFCPLKKFPKDKVKVKTCEECEHFHGYRKSFSDKVVKSLEDFGVPTQAFQRGKIQSGQSGQSVQDFVNQRRQQRGRQEQKSAPLNMTVIKPKKRLKPKPKLTEEDLEKALEEKRKSDEEWEKEEKKLQENANSK